jgi:hypothetical protein
MPDRERVIEVVGEWVGKAENDLIAAAYALRIGARRVRNAVRKRLPKEALKRRASSWNAHTGS